MVPDHDFKVDIDEGDSVSACLIAPESIESAKATLLILAHGAGNDMNSPLLSFVCDKLAASGVATMKFNFPYKEKGRKLPDPAPKLEATWRAVLARVRSEPKFAFERVFIGGKSLGGRMASRVVAAGEAVDGLVFLGYPLHPPGKPQKQRIAHFPQISVPSLFIQGTRDALCDLDLLRNALPQIPARTELHLVEGGDHSFVRLKRMGISEQETWREVVAAILQWLQARHAGIED